MTQPLKHLLTINFKDKSLHLPKEWWGLHLQTNISLQCLDYWRMHLAFMKLPHTLWHNLIISPPKLNNTCKNNSPRSLFSNEKFLLEKRPPYTLKGEMGKYHADWLFHEDCLWFVPSNKISNNWELLVLFNVGINNSTNLHFRFLVLDFILFLVLLGLFSNIAGFCRS